MEGVHVLKGSCHPLHIFQNLVRFVTFGMLARSLKSRFPVKTVIRSVPDQLVRSHLSDELMKKCK